ncbi:unnamed protein product [Albugo candida]|uniref:Uncharacterized protein n=1 Tax=Albugo candida TaxID=65357 RepID=A0A024GH21_9STRA|nr:unnamed protein product [Albugo candida]|eukprot:CCI46187.1 unnamed protein product [Albugo candida]
MRPESELTEEDSMRYFVEAKTSDNSRSLTLKKAMRKSQMTQEYDGKSLVDCLIRAFMNVLDEQDMENFDEEEPKLYIQYFVNALRPRALKDTVRAELKRQANQRYRADIPEFVAWLKPQVV